jgi:hypothetical protein
LEDDGGNLFQYERCAMKNRILFCQKSPNPQRILVSQLTHPQSQFKSEQSILIATWHPANFIYGVDEGGQRRRKQVDDGRWLEDDGGNQF